MEKFNKAFVTNSICAPSRAVLLTGKHSHRNGHIDNLVRFDSSQVTLQKILKKGGYTTAAVGKWHLKSQPTGFDYWNILPGQGDYYNPDFIDNGVRKNEIGYATDLITDKAIQWIRTVKNKDKPFFLFLGHKAPHREWHPDSKYFELYKNKDLPIPPTLFDDYANRATPAHDQEMSIWEDMTLESDLKLGHEIAEKSSMPGKTEYSVKRQQRILERLTPEQRAKFLAYYSERDKAFVSKPRSERELKIWKYQQFIKDYLRCIASVDDNVGRLLKYLDDNNLTENTLLIFTSDQGFFLGEHGWFDKRFMYEESLSIPLVARWPAKIKPGTENNDLVQNLDFAPTLLDAANLPVPSDMQGKSFLPLLAGQNKMWRDAIYYHYYEFAEHHVYPHYGIRTSDDKKLIHYYTLNEWEFFSLKEDPNELKNQINNKAFEEEIRVLKNKLVQLQRTYGDTAFVKKEH